MDINFQTTFSGNRDKELTTNAKKQQQIKKTKTKQIHTKMIKNQTKTPPQKTTLKKINMTFKSIFDFSFSHLFRGGRLLSLFNLLLAAILSNNSQQLSKPQTQTFHQTQATPFSLSN